MHCDSALDPECAINPDASIFSKVCNVYEEDKCYINISKFNVTRGCLREQKTDFEKDVCINPRKCTLCSETNGLGCNNQTIVMETCVDCDTENGDNCYDDLDKFKGKVCSDLDSVEKEGCYLSIVSKKWTFYLFFNQMPIHKFLYGHRKRNELSEVVSVTWMYP